MKRLFFMNRTRSHVLTSGLAAWMIASMPAWAAGVKAAEVQAVNGQETGNPLGKTKAQALAPPCETAAIRMSFEAGRKGDDWSGAAWGTFHGTAVKIVADTGPDRGMADVYLDGLWRKTVDWYSASPARGVDVFAAENLADSRHLLGILKRGAKNPRSSGVAVSWLRAEYVAGKNPDRFLPVRRERFDPNVPLWLDDRGEPIQGHMGGILFHGGKYYWLGMDWSGPVIPKLPLAWRRNRGFSVYSSDDLMNWTYHGNFCGPKSEKGQPEHPLANDTFMVSRIRGLRAAGTGKFVALFQLVGNPFGNVRKVPMNATAVAVADKPEGPYRWHDFFTLDGKVVQGSDTAVFTDEDGKQYFISAYADDNQGWNVSDCLYELAPDCLTAVRAKRLGTGGEAPALFKHEGVYYLLHSGLTALDPNDNFYHTARNIWGPWEAKGNVAQGQHSAKTFLTQTMDVVPVAGKKDAFIWIGDSIRGRFFPETRTVWLPVTLKANGEMEIRWRDWWDMSVFHPGAGPQPDK
jgi:hypothetical protein